MIMNGIGGITRLCEQEAVRGLSKTVRAHLPTGLGRGDSLRGGIAPPKTIGGFVDAKCQRLKKEKDIPRRTRSGGGGGVFVEKLGKNGADALCWGQEVRKGTPRTPVLGESDRPGGGLHYPSSLPKRRGG